jgi:hypothetical protein
MLSGAGCACGFTFLPDMRLGDSSLHHHSGSMHGSLPSCHPWPRTQQRLQQQQGLQRRCSVKAAAQRQPPDGGSTAGCGMADLPCRLRRVAGDCDRCTVADLPRRVCGSCRSACAPPEGAVTRLTGALAAGLVALQPLNAALAASTDTLPSTIMPVRLHRQFWSAVQVPLSPLPAAGCALLPRAVSHGAAAVMYRKRRWRRARSSPRCRMRRRWSCRRCRQSSRRCQTSSCPLFKRFVSDNQVLPVLADFF